MVNGITNINSVVFSAIILAGCAGSPSPNYDITSPIQAVLDYTNSTRHYQVQNGDIKTSWLTELLTYKGDAKLYKDRSWQQIIVKTEETKNRDVVEYRYQLEDNLSRVCAALRPDADLSMEAQALRGVYSKNAINACISSELGAEYPLFTFSWIRDPEVGEYLSLITPSGHYSDKQYMCKLKREGYSFNIHLYC